MKREFDDFTVEYDDSHDTKCKVFDRLIEFFIKHEAFDGECICQSDGLQIDAPVLLSEMADDIIQFNVDWK